MSDLQNRLKALKEERGRLHKSMKDLNEVAMSEKRSFTPEEDQKYQAIGADWDKIQADIRRIEGEIAREAEMAEVDLRQEENRQKGDTREEFQVKYRKAFRNWLSVGASNLSPEERTILAKAENRALAAGTDASGGYTVPEGFANKLEVALKWFGSVYANATILKTATGNLIPHPTMNDTGNVGALLTENNIATPNADPTFGVVNMEAFTFHSKPVLVSNLLLQDSAFNIDDYLAAALSERIARILNTYLTTGTGNSEPKGIITAATASGVTGATTTTITFDNLIDLFHSVDIAYRGTSKWMFHDSTLKALRKIKDEELRPIWQPGYTDGSPATILGKAYAINNDMAELGASAKTVLFGDISKYLVREVSGAVVRRLVERYADYNQTGYILFARFDGDLIDAGTHPVKYIAQPAT
jgi:HK97 family phage major capsid protein